jgi:nucleotide-binding universal stress UspA family protein
MIAQENIDIVVLASRGSESHFDFGSVAERVIKCTDKPTVIVPV